MATGESNKALVARARLGDPEALELLVRRHLRAACAVALAILGSPADAEDVAQEAFLIAFERLDTCRDPERFAGWLMQIVRTRALNSRGRKQARGAALEALPPPEESRPALDPAQVGLRERLLRGLDRLTPVQREVVLLHDLEGWTHPEIGQALEITEVASRQHLFQARRAMREFLDDEDAMEVRHAGHGR